MKTNCWFNRNRLLSHLRIATAGTLFSAAAAVVLFAAVPASSAPAEEQLFTIVYRLETVEQVGDQLFITATGQGHSMLLGNFTVDAVATQTLIPDACDTVSADLTITAGGGTITIHEEDLNCPSSLTGDWEVTGGTGTFSGANGSGTDRGAGSFTGRVVNRYTGSLSF